MALRNAEPFKFKAVGCSDTLDSTQTFEGAMTSLSNLIADPTTKNLWTARPASTVLAANFSTVNAGATGIVTCAYLYGDFLYGMVSCLSGTYSGFDIPFFFNLLTNTFTAVTGFPSTANLPASPPQTGDWVPPIMDLIGTQLVIAHAGYAGHGTFAGAIDISTPTAPAYSMFNLATNAFPSAPIAVAQFNGRAYYCCNPANAQPSLVFSDILDAKTRTNASQTLTLDDNQQLQSMGTLQLSNQLGGIIQSLIVFKGGAAIYQILGDAANTTTGVPLSKNVIGTSVGCVAPLSIANVPEGLTFLDHDGFRLIDQQANVTPPIGDQGAGINVPFQYTAVPTRVVAAANGKIARATTQNGNALGSPQQEWWFDLVSKNWTGPHTFPASLIFPYRDTFILIPIGTARIFRSDYKASSSSTYIEDGVQLMYKYQTALIPDTGKMSRYQCNEAYIYMSFDVLSDTVTVAAQDQTGNALDATYLTAINSGSLWGTMTWGTGLWGGLPHALSPVQIKWNLPLVFDRAQFSFTGNCNAGVEFGDLWLMIQDTGYMKGSLP